MKTILCLLSLCLWGCAATSKIDVEAIKREQESHYSDRTISIHSLPDGALVDLNGDVVGTTPCTLELKRCYESNWPANGYPMQTLRARWFDGMVEFQNFLSNADAPAQVAFMHPNALALSQRQPTLHQTVK